MRSECGNFRTKAAVSARLRLEFELPTIPEHSPQRAALGAQRGLLIIHPAGPVHGIRARSPRSLALAEDGPPSVRCPGTLTLKSPLPAGTSHPARVLISPSGTRAWFAWFANSPFRLRRTVQVPFSKREHHPVSLIFPLPKKSGLFQGHACSEPPFRPLCL